MDAQEFKNFRSNLQKTQEEMSRLMGLSVKAIRSYEQGWRAIPAHAERQLLFLAAKKAEITTPIKPCWVVNKCKDPAKKFVPGLGISGRQALLVHQRHHLQRHHS